MCEFFLLGLKLVEATADLLWRGKVGGLTEGMGMGGGV